MAEDALASLFSFTGSYFFGSCPFLSFDNAAYSSYNFLSSSALFASSSAKIQASSSSFAFLSASSLASSFPSAISCLNQFFICSF